ncbi:MAG: mdtA [Phycisphaerales bacterium]|nr:mdtA [Phycisphaerales bacterium]
MTTESTEANRPLPVAQTFKRQSEPDRQSQPQARQGGSLWWLWLIVVGLALGALVWFVVLPRFMTTPATAGAGGGRGGPVPVVTAVARKGEMNLYLDGLGSVTALNTVTVRARVDGELVKVAYSEGQVVQKGQLLAEIDPRPFQVQLTEAEGQWLKDQAALKNAQADLERYKTLLAQSLSVTQQQVDTQQALVTQDMGAVKTDEGQIANAKLQLSYCEITAPFTGRVGLRLVDQGNMVHATDANGLVVLAQLQPIAVVFTIPQDSIGRVQSKMTADHNLVVDAYDRDLKKKLAAGTLLAIDNQVDQGTGTVRLKGLFKNTDAVLFPNEFVNARLLVDTLHDAVIVPTAAVQRGPDSNFVYVVKPNETVEMKTVVTGPAEGDDIVIKSGLAPGDVVVTDGVDKLQQGAKVSTRSRKAGGNEAATRPNGANPTTRPMARGSQDAQTPAEAGDRNAATRPDHRSPSTQAGGGAQ